jgi:1-acyl-sn-glycerol-3-phosphate acyltransferase
LDKCDFGGKTVIPIATCGSNMKGFLEDFETHIKNGKVIPIDGFYAVDKETEETLNQKVSEWLKKL